MAAFKTESRLKEMYRRQDPYRFGTDYLAATMATKAEAPGRSRPSQLYARRFHRHLQNISIPERIVNCLALYNPAVVEIHDQNLLWPNSHINPLAAFRPITNTVYPAFKGTLDVADRLGYLSHHPTLSVGKGASRKLVPWPYQGDSLLFIEAESTYCVDWTVKDKRRAFLTPPPGPERHEEKRRIALRARFEIQAQYYLDVDIRTQPTTAEEVDDIVAVNLLKLCTYSHRDAGLIDELVQDLEAALVQGLVSGTPPSVTIARFVLAERCSLEQGRIVFYQAIWERKLRPELFAPILIDRPIEPEVTDLIEYYSDWFER